MQIIDNINHIVKNDLQESIRTGSKLSIAAACFSIYAYQELKKQLESIDELRFIFTSPTFVTEKIPKAQREFYIPRISRECSLYGTEFEVKLRNELTQKAVAKECADWIRRKAIFKSNVTQEQMMGFMTVDESTYMPINGFTTVDLGCERGNNAYYPVQKTEAMRMPIIFSNFLNNFGMIKIDYKKLQTFLLKTFLLHTAKTHLNTSILLRFIIFSTNFLMIYLKTNCLTRQRVLRKVKSGGCFITSSATQFLPSSANLRNSTAVFWQTALVSARHLLRLQ